MSLRIGRYLNLLWRLVGVNLLVILVGIIQADINGELSRYAVYSSILLIIYVLMQILTRKLSMKSNVSDVMRIYVICKVVVDLTLIKNETQVIFALLVSIIEGLWIIKFYLSLKRQS